MVNTKFGILFVEEFLKELPDTGVRFYHLNSQCKPDNRIFSKRIERRLNKHGMKPNKSFDETGFYRSSCERIYC